MEAEEIKLELPWPVSANAYWRPVNNRLIKTAEAREYIGKVVLHWQDVKKEQKLKPFPVGTELAVAISAHYPKRRGPDADLDNLQKVLIDSLETAQIFDNDQCIRHIQITRESGVPQGMVRVYLRPVKSGLHLDKSTYKVLGVHEHFS